MIGRECKRSDVLSGAVLIGRGLGQADKSKCDYHFPRPLEDAEAAELERRINEVLAQHMPVRTETLPREEAGKLVDLGRLPAHLEGEEGLMVRIVTVGDYDICPCIGGACGKYI